MLKNIAFLSHLIVIWFQCSNIAMLKVLLQLIYIYLLKLCILKPCNSDVQGVYNCAILAFNPP